MSGEVFRQLRSEPDWETDLAEKKIKILISFFRQLSNPPGAHETTRMRLPAQHREEEEERQGEGPGHKAQLPD